ncbi:hypothetical protein FK531_12955 [Rhodococcus spelaei]|uniref:Uncharacterized protein n=1 Tax=Rhodococcus spelaei TaxID=2546320 RepID=A0A541B8R0_9NOCA|nr:hypothetical protein [Rhodococcus spelaei]TQF68709.1 hypothetical protein FK531_12955 [Rhodococcus spelaei]
MAGKGIDKVKTQAALETVRESPAIALMVATPGIVLFGLGWWLLGFWPTLLIAVILGVVVVAGRKFLG